MQGNSINCTTLQHSNEMCGKAKVWCSKNKIGQRRNTLYLLAIASIFMLLMRPDNLSAAIGGEMGASSGVFSVSPTEKVCFAQGNLLYQASTNTWRFAKHQYDCNIKGWIEHYSWGKGSTNTNMEDSHFIDWGKNKITNGGNNQWRTLTIEEWQYVIDQRTTSSGIRFAKAKVKGVNGLILLPDDWKASTFNLKNTNQAETGYSNVINVSQWNVLESAGAVFLPCTGYFDDEFGIVNRNNYGYYWSASTEEDDFYDAYSIFFGDSEINTGNYFYRYLGYPVRLVCPAQ